MDNYLKESKINKINVENTEIRYPPQNSLRNISKAVFSKLSHNMSQKLSLEERKKLYGGRATPEYRLAKLHDYGGDMSKRWTVEFWVWDQNLNNGKGGLHRKQKKFSTKLSAEERRKKAQDFIYEINEYLILGYHIKLKSREGLAEQSSKAKEDITFLEAVEKILLIKEAKLKPNSYKDYRLECNKLMFWVKESFGDDLLLKDFSTELALEFLDNEQVTKSLTNRTRNNKLAVFKSIFEELRTRKYITENPFRQIRKERQKKPQKHSFRPYHKEILLPFMKQNDPQLYYACLFEYYLFLRPSEIQTLKISQIIWEDKKVIINNDNKSGKPRFPVISNACEKIILEMNLLDLNPEWYVFGKDGVPGPLMTGNNTLRTRFMEIRDHLKIEKKYTFYSWKHTGNLDSLRAGVNIKAIQQQNGHEDLATTDEYLQSLGYEHNEEIRSIQPHL